MNEISRCCQLLGVQPGASADEVAKAYRDLVQVWHPDRFSNNNRLRIKAEEQLKEINLAYEYLTTHAFQDGVLVNFEETPAEFPSAAETEPEPAPDSTPSEENAAAPEEPASRKRLWLVAIALIVVISYGAATLLYFKYRAHTRSAVPTTTASSQSAPDTNSTAQNASASNSESPAAFSVSKEILAAMTSTPGEDWIQGRELLTPPFAMHAKLKLSDLNELALFFGVGRLVFNSRDHPKILRFQDPRNGRNHHAEDKGLLLPNQPYDIVWKFDPDEMTVTVNGDVRFRVKGNYKGLKGYAGINSNRSATTVESFTLETPAPVNDSQPPAHNRAPIANDILSSLVPQSGTVTTNQPDGLAFFGDDSGASLHSTQKFRPPFAIRTRAKTDGLNLRLNCGEGQIILNWEITPHELRVHDPLNGQQVGVAGKGMITPNDWHEIIWDIQRDGMTLYVDGRLRFQKVKDYRTLNAPAGIGTYRAKLTVDYFVVDQK